MASVSDRVRKLLALAGSPNMHEARNAAYLAAKLIREHGLELHEGPRKTPAPRKTPSPKRTPGSKRGVRAVPEPPKPIESPLGGDCIVCNRRYRAGTEILWSEAEGGMHTGCFDEWVRRRARR